MLYYVETRTETGLQNSHERVETNYELDVQVLC